MQIYPWQIEPTRPLLQLTIDVCNTTTPKQFYVWWNAHIPLADVPPPPIDHISIEGYYTNYVSHIEECTYTHGRSAPPPPPIEHRCLVNNYTK